MTRTLRLAVIVLLLTSCSTLDVGGPIARKNDPSAGTLTLDSGKQVAILPQDLNFTGVATYRWPDGKEQSGQWVEGSLNGMGIETLGNETYKGQWSNGQRHGHGEVRSAGRHYLGDFRNGLRHGAGTQTATNGVYKGSWQSDTKHGYGKLDASDGSSYEGQWFAGARNGYGRSVDATGSQYEGDWVTGAAHGFGTRSFADGSVYSGGWKSGYRHGYGKLTTVSSLVYEGIWANDLQNGHGREVRPDKSTYDGQWSNGNKHGTGSNVFADGRRHDGNWEAGRPMGPGTRTHRSGISITGAWTNDVLSHGLIAFPSGAEFAGNLFRNSGTEVSNALLAWLTDNAAAGDEYAQLYLASAYLDFQAPQPDPQTAKVWLQRSASAGVGEAQFRLALLLRESDVHTHLQLLRSAGDSGHPRALTILGEFYQIGLYVEQSLPAAVTHYERAIDLGSINAANNLAWLLATTNNPDMADAQRAIDLILPIVMYYGDWQYLDTLAAAHARAGNMDIAMQMQKQALLEVKNDAPDELVAELESRLELYQAGEAYTE